MQLSLMRLKKKKSKRIKEKTKEWNDLLNYQRLTKKNQFFYIYKMSTFDSLLNNYILNYILLWNYWFYTFNFDYETIV